jgi:hypothetical protein
MPAKKKKSKKVRAEKELKEPSDLSQTMVNRFQRAFALGVAEDERTGKPEEGEAHPDHPSMHEDEHNEI